MRVKQERVKITILAVAMYDAPSHDQHNLSENKSSQILIKQKSSKILTKQA